MIKNDRSHNDVFNLQVRIVQDSFPFPFNLTNIREIQATGDYLLTLLIFGYPHRLLWEGALFRQNLAVNHSNQINFVLNDVCTGKICSFL